MTVAVMMDFSGETITTRDGIFVYLYYLLKSWLENNKKINIEVWIYSHSEKVTRKLFGDLLEKYGDRLIICNDKLVYHVQKEDYIFNSMARMILIIFQRSFKYFKIQQFEKIVNHKIDIYTRKAEESKYDLIEAFKQYSKADICYVPFVTLRAALEFGKPTVVQVHDLFTFQFYELFMKQANPPALYFKYNKYVKEILGQYARLGAKFVCSSEYTFEHQLLQYIPNVKKKNCNVIAFPPLITQFNKEEVMSKKEFINKFNIDCQYIAFPSQNRPNKNLILLLRALKKVNEQGYKIKLVTTGKMADVNETNKFCKSNPEIVIEIGSLSKEELYCLYKYSDLVVCPNLIEGMNISGQALEALAIGGIPVVHAKTLGIETSLKRVGLDFNTADFNWVELDDVTGLAEKIIEVLKNPQKCIDKQTNIYAAYKKITWVDVSKDYISLFENIIS